MTARVYPTPPPAETVTVSLETAELSASALVRLKERLEAELAEKWDAADSFERCNRSQEIARIEYAITEIGPLARVARERHVRDFRRWCDQRDLVGIHDCGDGRFLCPQCRPGLDHVVCACGGELEYWKGLDTRSEYCPMCLARRRPEHDAEFGPAMVGRETAVEVA